MYKESYYNFKEVVNSGDTVLYNTRTGAIAVVEPKFKDKVKEMLACPDSYQEDEFFQPLLANGFLIPDEMNELQKIRENYEKEFKRKDAITVVLLPAELCNFTCEYCFVYNYKGKVMEQETYDGITRYIEHKVEQYYQEYPNGKKIDLRISWFGGEPLLERDTIFKYMELIEERFSNSCVIWSDIVTNGYYLTSEVFKKLLAHKINVLQVTFDGAKEDHNKTRCLHNGEGSYDTLIANIKDIVANLNPNEKFRFAFRINFMKNTYKKIYGLIDELHDIVGDDPRFFVYCRPVYNFETKRDTMDQLIDNIFTIEDGLKQQNDFSYYIDKKFNRVHVERSVNDYLPIPTVQWCSEDNEYSIIVGADASVYSCDSLIGDESVSIGKMFSDGTIQFKENVKEWKTSFFELENNKECLKCRCLPACLGCCRRERIMDKRSKPCLFTEQSIKETIQKFFAKA